MGFLHFRVGVHASKIVRKPVRVCFLSEWRTKFRFQGACLKPERLDRVAEFSPRSPREALKWVSRGRALENAHGRLRGERARTSRGCGGVSARQGDIGAVEDSMSDAEYTLATRTA